MTPEGFHYNAQQGRSGTERAGAVRLCRAIAMLLFSLSNASLYLGLGGAFLSEAAPSGVMARGAALFGAGASFLTAALMLGLLAGVGHMMFAAPGSLLALVMTVYLGIRIWAATPLMNPTGS